jgi:hypothetical protein
MAGIRQSANRPKLAKHLRGGQTKAHVNRTQEDRDRDHQATDAWAERQKEGLQKEAERLEAERRAHQEADRRQEDA